MLKRLEYLDCARGIAALIVAFYHFKISYLLPEALDFLDFTPLGILWFGDGAVVFFFFLSGYVLSLKHFKDPAAFENFNYLSYLLSRAFRIYPVFLLVLLLSILSKHTIYPGNIITIPSISFYGEHLWKDQSSYIHQALLITRFREDPYLLLMPQSWTLQIELLVSALIPFFILICLRSPIWMFIFSFIIVGFMRFEPYLIGFIIGIAVAYYSDLIKIQWKGTKKIYRALFIIIGLLFYCSSFVFKLDIHSTAKLASFIGNTFLLITLIASEGLQQFLNKKFLLFLGRISYCIYLCHMIVLLAIIPYVFLYVNNNLGITDAYITRLIGLVFYVFLTILFSYILHLAIEKPFISLYRKINNRINERENFILSKKLKL